MGMKNEFTVKEFAEKERVSTRTVRTWMAKGAVDFRRTPGGRVRITDGSSSVVLISMKSAEVRGSSAQ
jgi:predicted site-specific integrase-resolvase